nr:MAG TPA: hypothetical protein [Caudoviricetes sp.]
MHLRTCSPLALTPSTLACGLPSASPPLGNYSARFSPLAVIQRVSGRAFVGDGTRWACRLSPEFPHCAPCSLPPGGGLVLRAARCGIVQRRV